MTDAKSLLQGLFAAGDAGDLDSFPRFLADDVIVHAPLGLSTTGLQAEMDSWSRARAAIPNLRHEFAEILSDGLSVSARCVVTGTMRGTYGELSAEGREFKIDQAVFAHVRDGRITELWEIVDTATLLRQLGALLPESALD